MEEIKSKLETKIAKSDELKTLNEFINKLNWQMKIKIYLINGKYK